MFIYVTKIGILLVLRSLLLVLQSIQSWYLKKKRQKHGKTYWIPSGKGKSRCQILLHLGLQRLLF